MGIFFHMPFPSSGVFKMLRFRIDLLKSLLCADLIGFHLFEHARNFMICTHRLMGLDYEFRPGGYLGIKYHGKMVMVRVRHIGIDENMVQNLMKDKKYNNLLKGFDKVVQNKYVIASLDQFHSLSGLKNKLLGFREFLLMQKEKSKDIVLIQFLTPLYEIYG